jgi:hypothetical protein
MLPFMKMPLILYRLNLGWLKPWDESATHSAQSSEIQPNTLQQITRWYRINLDLTSWNFLMDEPTSETGAG